MPLDDLLRMVAEVDAVDTVYYVFMYGWVRVFGDSETSLRIPSLLVMTATAGLVAILGRRLASYRAGLFAGLAFAVIPAVSRYAQEARAYAFVMLLAVVATLLLDRICRPPNIVGHRWKLYLGYAAVVTGLGYLHVLSLLLIPAHGVVILIESRKRGWKFIARWVAAVLVGLVPLIPMVWMAAHQQHSQNWIPESHFRDLFIRLPEKLTAVGTVSGMLFALAALQVSRRRSSVMLLSWLIAPPLLLFVVSRFTELFWFRYLLFIVPALALLAGLTLARIRILPAVATLLALFALGWYWHPYYRTPSGHEHDTRGVGQVITQNFRPGDAIAYAYGPEESMFWEPRDAVKRYVPADRHPRDAFVRVPQRADGNFRAVECPDTQLAVCLAEAPRVWVVRFENKPDPLRGLTPPLKEKVLRDGYHLEKVWPLRAFTVAVYVRNQ